MTNSTKNNGIEDESNNLENIAKDARLNYQQMIPLAGLSDVVSEIRNLEISAKNPSRNIPLRLYFPILDKNQSSDNLPVFLFSHGGGFISGDLNTHDNLCRAIANGANCIVVAVEYRLAPENPFPAGLNDIYAALLWIKDNAIKLNADPTRIAVGGDSAGGNLSAALTIFCRDKNESHIVAQWLMYPTLSNKMDTESWKNLGNEYFPTVRDNTVVIQAYVPNDKSPYDPLIAPFWANLANLPPALIQVGGLDPLCDECRFYAEKLNSAGNKAKFIFYPNYTHGFLQFYKNEEMYPNASAALQQGLDWLKHIFANR